LAAARKAEILQKHTLVSRIGCLHSVTVVN